VSALPFHSAAAPDACGWLVIDAGGQAIEGSAGGTAASSERV
jgi:hypothetical protein